MPARLSLREHHPALGDGAVPARQGTDARAGAPRAVPLTLAAAAEAPRPGAGVGAPDGPPPPPPNRLLLGDNLGAMAALLPTAAGSVDLIYVDPPFASGGEYVLREGGGVERAYTDRWEGGLAGYLDMLAPRLVLMRELLAPHGSFYIHLDPVAAHYVKVVLDELYGPECFQREIIWRIGWISGYKSAVRNWVRNHDTLLFYTKDPKHFTFHKEYVPHLPGYRRRGGGEGRGHPVEDVWNANAAELALEGEDSLDSIQIRSFSREKTGFETQKNLSLLRRVISASSHPGDLVADFFCGSGTTLVAAEGLGRRWLGCDSGAAAQEVTRQRLLALPRRAALEVVVAAAGEAAQGQGGQQGQGAPTARRAPDGEAAPAAAPDPRTTIDALAPPPPPERVVPPATFVDDEVWARAAPLLPIEPRRTGRPRRPARDVLSAALWLRTAGARPEDLPRAYGSLDSIRARLREWEGAGVLARLEAAGILPAVPDAPQGARP